MNSILPVSRSQSKRLAVQRGFSPAKINGRDDLQATNKVRKEVAALAARLQSGADK
tara:strand:- start:460 stop:627 length:168 start_codon:yes stop_codon:yes gene_type:complete